MIPIRKILMWEVCWRFLMVLKLMFLTQTKKKSKFYKTATNCLKTQQIYQQRDPQKQKWGQEGLNLQRNVKSGAKQDTNREAGS